MLIIGYEPEFGLASVTGRATGRASSTFQIVIGLSPEALYSDGTCGL